MSYNPFSLSGKTILVTGASSGIGQATAIECSKLGAKVVITGRNSERLQETMNQLEGDGHQQTIAELTNTDDISALVNFCPELDGVVLCAGKSMTLPFKFCSREKYDDIFNVNFFSPVECLRLLLKKKRLVKGSSVVFICSIGGTAGFSVGNSVYGASKAAILSTMKFCALECAPLKIRVNTINPGMVDTPLIHRTNLTEEQLLKDTERYPLKRYGLPVEIAHSAIYLLSDAAGWITGNSIVIDGGRTI